MVLTVLLFYVLGQLMWSCQASTLIGVPQQAVAGEAVNITLTCEVNHNNTFVSWIYKTFIVATQSVYPNGSCYIKYLNPNFTSFIYQCDPSNRRYHQIMPILNLSENEDGVWRCEDFFEDTPSNEWSIQIAVLVTNVTLTPSGIDVVEDENETFACTTGPSRPAAWIQWYIGGLNVTNQATSQKPQQEGNYFISLSRLMYTGRDKDHNKSIYCEAINIEGRTKARSLIESLNIQVPVKIVTIQSGIDYIAGENRTLNCTTGPSRPSSTIQWYIGGRNVTSQAKLQLQKDGDKFVSFSKLLYTVNDTDHNKSLYCVAINIKETAAVKSTILIIEIKVPVINVTLIPTGNNNVVDVVEGENQTFTCTTSPSRPAAWIQWYIGGRNVTNQAIPQLLQQDGNKFVSSSRLDYIGNDIDHNTSLYCEAVNFDAGPKIPSLMKTFFIKVPLTTVNITPNGNNNIVDVVEGENQTFTCTTGPSRPAAWIQWYIGGQNITYQATSQQPQLEDDMFISSSRLTFIGNDTNNNKSLYCEAVNIEGSPKSKSMKLTIMVKVLVKAVIIIPTGDNNKVDVIERENQTFNCTTGLSRPAAWIQWYIGGLNVTNKAIPQEPQPDGDKFVSSSILIYTGNDVDHNKSIYCEAVNVQLKQGINSTAKSLYIQVKPKNIRLEPQERNYTIRETHHITGISCTALCRPECQYYWSGTNNYMQNQSSLLLGSVYRNESGTYTCHGSNTLGNISSSGVYIDVLYPPFITNMTINSNATVAEGTMAIFQCYIESNPKSNIEWKLMGTGKVVHRDFAVLKSDFSINRTECSHTGIYMCQATNIINDVQEISSQTIRFYVLCSVRIDVNQVSTPTTIRVKSEDGLNITTHLIAVPPPVISWTFYSNMTGNTSSINSTDIFGDFAHVSNLQKFNMSQADFGVYTLTAYNNAITKYQISFNVIPQRPPNPPSDILVFCYTSSMKATWKSEFNGGNTQTFRVIWWDNFSPEKNFGKNISDPGEGSYQEDIITNLLPGTLYFLKVEAKNIHGTVVSNEHVNCTTEGRTKEESNTAILGTVLGSASGLVVILLIVGIIFFIRRRIGKGEDEHGRRHLTRLKPEEEDEDGLKDNVLYQSVGSNFKQQQDDSGKEYAAVQRKEKELKGSNVQETALYSEVKGKPKNKPQRDVYLNVTNAKKKANGNISKPSDDVYENMDIIENGSPKIVPEENKNKDGLQYAELVFNHVPNESKFVIRGIEDRTIYAIVDTTQNIDPLPDSDDEDIGKSTQLDKSENEME